MTRPRADFVVGRFRNAFMKNSLRMLRLLDGGRPARHLGRVAPDRLPLTRE